MSKQLMWDPYEELGNAIIAKAAQDYIDSYKVIKKSEQRLETIQKEESQKMQELFELNYRKDISEQEKEAKEEELDGIRKKRRCAESRIYRAKDTIREVEKFFLHSELYQLITEIDGSYLLKRLTAKMEVKK